MRNRLKPASVKFGQLEVRALDEVELKIVAVEVEPLFFGPLAAEGSVLGWFSFFFGLGLDLVGRLDLL